MVHPEYCCSACGEYHTHWCLQSGREKCEMGNDKPLMHNGVVHGTVHESGEMSVHLDIKTGELMKNAKEYKDMGDHVEIIT